MNITDLRNSFTDLRAKIEELPDAGSVLFCEATALAISIPDDDADRGHIAGLIFARIFSDADRRATPPVPGLDRSYSDGAGRKFRLYAIGTAKRIALSRLDAAIAALPMVEGE